MCNISIILNPYIGLLDQNRKFRGKEEYTARPATWKQRNTLAASSSGIKDKLLKKCKYVDDHYLQFWFISTGEPSAPDAQCVLLPNLRN
jgi:hypothetical protein